MYRDDKMTNENIKNETNEETNIIDYILQKFSDKLYDKEHLFYIITKSGELYDLGTYEDLLKENPDISKAYIFIANLWFSYNPVLYYCPFIGTRGLLATVYFLKYYYGTPFEGLKYITLINHFSSIDRTVMEVGDLELITEKISLVQLRQMFRKEEDEDEKVGEFKRKFRRLGLFNDYNVRKTEEILNKYYKEKDESLADDVKSIKEVYYYTFRSYRVILPSNP